MATPSAATPASEVAPGGSETILLVEDEDAVRRLAVQALRSRGYTVLETRDGREALAVAEGHGSAVALVVSDVVMPRIGGPELVARLRLVRPGIRWLFMSGYTDNAIVRSDGSTAMSFLGKPFTLDALVRKVREVLDSPQPPLWSKGAREGVKSRRKPSDEASAGIRPARGIDMEQIRVEDRGRERWIVLSGELDQDEVLRLKAEFDMATKRAKNDVVVDLGAVTFIGTLGIGLIVSTREQLEERGLTLKLASVPAFIEKTFKVMSLTEVFERV